jgi:heptosyltransferase-2
MGKDQKVRSVLLIRTDRFGEFLLTVPAIQQVKRVFPQARVTLLARAANASLVQGCAGVDDCIPYDVPYHPVRRSVFADIAQSVVLANRLRPYRFDVAVAFNAQKIVHLALLFAGIPLRVGQPSKWHWALNRTFAASVSLEGCEEIERNHRILDAWCAHDHAATAQLSSDAASFRALGEHIDLSKRYVALHPFTSHAPKELPEGLWKMLAARLAKQYSLVVIGDASERDRAEAFAAAVGAISLAGKLSLNGLSCFYARAAKAHIGLDSGPYHLAVLHGVPTVGLFTVSDEKRWGHTLSHCRDLREKAIEDFVNDPMPLLAALGLKEA